MKSRPYSTLTVKNVCIEEMVRDRRGVGCDVGIDASKREVRAVVRWSSGGFERPWRIALCDLAVFVEKLRELAEGRSLAIAMEPTGTYGDPVRQALHDGGFKLRRVNPKTSHDYAEVLDGVPSQHDGKDAACVAELSALGKGREWPWSITGRELREEIDWMNAHQQTLTGWLGRVEALLARFWPEACAELALSSATLLRVLEHYGDPRALAADPEALARLKRWGGSKLDERKIRQLIENAWRTIGVRMEACDRAQIQRYAREALRARREVHASKKRLAQLTRDNEVVRRQARIVGRCTAAVLWAHLGDPNAYHSAGAYRKAMGLNLKERSSGRWQGQLKITKRGPSQVRRWLYFAALRYCRQGWIRPWYEAKKGRGAGCAKRALVAIMRKLALALYRVAVDGREFEVQRLIPGARRYVPTAQRSKRCIPEGCRRIARGPSLPAPLHPPG